jgi:hypothetical protein
MTQIVSAAPGWIATDEKGRRRLVVAWAVAESGDAMPVFISDRYKGKPALLEMPSHRNALTDSVPD